VDRSDQRSKITIIQEQGFPLREGSVLPDLSAPKYQIPRPPPPPLFSISKAQSSTLKRSREAAFGGDDSSAHSPGIRQHHRPRPAIPKGSYDGDEPVESVELETQAEDGRVTGRRREAPVGPTEDLQLSTSRRAANVGPDVADHKILC
jgi:hypothetical protein